MKHGVNLDFGRVRNTALAFCSFEQVLNSNVQLLLRREMHSLIDFIVQSVCVFIRCRNSLCRLCDLHLLMHLRKYEISVLLARIIRSSR